MNAADDHDAMGEEEKKVNFVLHNTIKSVTADLTNFSFNTAIARLMELTNALYRYTDGPINKTYALNTIQTMMKLMAPFAPHFAEELWERLGGELQHFQSSPSPNIDESALVAGGGYLSPAGQRQGPGAFLRPRRPG